MNTLPCQSDVGQELLDMLADEAALKECIIERACAIADEYRQDLERISEAVSDIAVGIGWWREAPGVLHNHPLALTFVSLIRDGNDDAELGRMLRKAVDDALCEQAEAQATDEFNREPEGEA